MTDRYTGEEAGRHVRTGLEELARALDAGLRAMANGLLEVANALSANFEKPATKPDETPEDKPPTQKVSFGGE